MDEILDGWLDALASDGPTPGGGAAAALMVATGAALVEMACGLTLGREKYRDVEELMAETLRQARALRAHAEELRTADSSAFEAVSAAYALPRVTPEDKSFRSARIQEVLRYATEVPLRTAETGTEVLELAAAIVSVANPNVISDAGSGALAARAGVEASALNVLINLSAIKDATYVETQRASLEALIARATSASDETLAAVRARIGG